MKEHFNIVIPRFNNLFKWSKIIVCLILSFIVVFPILGYSTIPAILSFIILFFILYIIMNSITNENLSNDLPNTLYPSMPHTGLDGISLNNYIAGMDINSL
jgi:hypothetical protein